MTHRDAIFSPVVVQAIKAEVRGLMAEVLPAHLPYGTDTADVDMRHHVLAEAERAESDGTLSHRHLLLARTVRAVAERDPKQLIKRLDMIAAYAVAWRDQVTRDIETTRRNASPPRHGSRSAPAPFN